MMQIVELQYHRNMEQINSSSSVLLLLSIQQVSDHANSTLRFLASQQKFFSFLYPGPAAAGGFAFMSSYVSSPEFSHQ
jgi:hypothetical protein